MAAGPGKYDAMCTLARITTGATSVLLLVQGGDLGDGFEVQSTDPAFGATLPTLLRTMADEIEKTIEGDRRSRLS